SGELDMHIGLDGTWYYEGGPVTQLALDQLFSGILRLEEDGRYYLVTQVEKCGIRVDDVPFVAVRLEVEGAGEQQRLRFFTSLEQEVVADAAHPISVSVDPDSGEPSPYVLLRDNLRALIHRIVFYELVERATEHQVDGR